MWKPWLGLGLFGATIAVAVGGPPIFSAAAVIWAADLELLLWDSIYSEWIFMPSLFLILFGFGIGFYLLPAIFRWRRKPEEIAAFQTRLGEIGPIKSKFFRYLSRAYGAWRDSKTDFRGEVPKRPNDINLLLQDTAYPNWVPVGRRKNLYDVAISKARQEPPTAFRFTMDLYGEIEEYKKRQDASPTLLSRDECLEFDGARQSLIYLWSDIARAIYKDRKFGYGDIKDFLGYDERTIKALAFLEISLHIHIHQVGEGDQYFYKLGRRHFYPRFSNLNRPVYNIPRILRGKAGMNGAQ